MRVIEQTSLQDALWFPGVGDHGVPPTDMLEVQNVGNSLPSSPLRIQHKVFTTH